MKTFCIDGMFCSQVQQTETESFSQTEAHSRKQEHCTKQKVNSKDAFCSADICCRQVQMPAGKKVSQAEVLTDSENYDMRRLLMSQAFAV